jgi:biotin-dependent carboxylase-like uncharacterized protein
VSYLQIYKAGIASSVQDSGRVSTLSIGIPPSGAMDLTALLSGQHQLGHHHDEAAVEMAYADFAATLTDTHDVVVTGAPVRLSINQQPVTSKGVLRIEAGQTLEMKATNEGVYSYLHLSGGIMTTPQLDSRSTSPREAIGGLDGGFLKDGDNLPLSAPDRVVLAADPQLPTRKPKTVLELRVVGGFQFSDFADEAIKGLLTEEFTVTAKASRMGVTLNGAQLQSGITSLFSEATCYGAIQVPPDGNPIVLLNDRQTVGGYPKPGAVIRSDCVRLAQSRPGQRVRFALCSPDEADRISWLEQHYLETRLRDAH